MGQLSLFDNPPPTPAKVLSRTSHPETSKAAAKEIVESGVLETMESVALAAVMDMQGATARELDEAHSHGATNSVGKRLDGLAKKGAIRRGDDRKCKVTGRMAQTWWPTEAVR